MAALTLGRLPGLGPLDRTLLLLSIAASVAFMATRPMQPFPGAVVLKRSAWPRWRCSRSESSARRKALTV